MIAGMSSAAPGSSSGGSQSVAAGAGVLQRVEQEYPGVAGEPGGRPGVEMAPGQAMNLGESPPTGAGALEIGRVSSSSCTAGSGGAPWTSSAAGPVGRLRHGYVTAHILRID